MGLAGFNRQRAMLLEEAEEAKKKIEKEIPEIKVVKKEEPKAKKVIRKKKE